jgi:chemotaxis protein methyltransferase WspC
VSRFPRTVAWLRERTKLEPALLAGRAFEDTVATRLRELGLADDAEYAARLESDPSERKVALTLVAVPETWVFRTRASFEWLRERLAARRRERPGERLRMLSAACANGAEAYSMAATALAAGFPAGSFRIDAIDVNDAALAEARGGRFRGFTIRDPLPDWAGEAFAATADGLAVAPALVDAVRFEHADVFGWNEPAGGRYAAVFCRNLMIYLAPSGRHELVRRLVRWLEPDGVLIVGHADACPELLAEFRGDGPAGAFAYVPGAVRVEPRPAARREPPPPRPAPTPFRVDRSPPPVAPAVGPAPSPDLSTVRRLMAEARWTEAAEAVARLLRSRPDLAEAHAAAGEIALARGGLAAAGDSFRKALYLDPASETALIRLAEVAERQGRPDEADRYRERAMRVHLGREGADSGGARS